MSRQVDRNQPAMLGDFAREKAVEDFLAARIAVQKEDWQPFFPGLAHGDSSVAGLDDALADAHDVLLPGGIPRSVERLPGDLSPVIAVLTAQPARSGASQCAARGYFEWPY